MWQKIYLLTGANRGIGLGLLKILISREHTLVIAGVRDPDSASAKALLDLPTAGSCTKVILSKIEVSSQESIKAAVKKLTEEDGIERIDVLISNAGIANYYGPAAITPLKEVREHFEVNAVGTLSLFQETWPLLEKSERPVFMALSTGVGSIGDMESMPLKSTAYGASKAALNYMMRKIHLEYPNLIAFPISPGWVQTEMGNHGAKSHGMETAPTTLDECVAGVIGKLDGATREETSGNFISYDDTKFGW
ncbi:NAD(P)-binding Rossmann-fold containing protein [Glarea lozoyensis ATCC 20868]|uniref:NAD(P)-binding Rossmann-fold containing protein n=1 Tax=Glarea lozoyensis (strain ATCC 20868 / MF5171) TaxID=1116229 RepID=S3DIZ3_GLAL2|nr:NAD(P)-binding Rossmann-fold containing protein [Glarea lozoyensis ATCC 20868]EPE32006.1 NAD(P)-binding Rossmann-fold containing protein [Glarea lozoyensis ATCC 20868]